MKSVLQLTDLHIFEDANRTLLPIDTKESFTRVLNFALADGEKWDLIVLSGDLADLGEAASYAWIAEMFSEIDIPTIAVAGNHDDREHLKKHFECPSAINLGKWRISLLDSCPLPGVTGELAAKELATLREHIEAYPAAPHLIFLHHPPIALNSSWMDAMGLKNASAFWDCIDNEENVVAVVNGHVHQNFDTYRDGVRVLSTPSTCTQFVPRADRFELDPRAPGYRRIALSEDGKMDTEVKRVPLS